MRFSDLVVRRACRGLALTFLTLSTFASLAFAQPPDAPSLSFTRSGFFRIDLQVQAGPSGAPDGFVIQWMKKSEFDAFGWPEYEYDPRAASCDFLGDPTLNPDLSSGTFKLAPNGVIGVQMGDLFDETGVDGAYLDHLYPGEYVFRVWAEGNSYGSAPSAPSSSVFAATTNPECTQGFWKNHPGVWPLGCLPMTLGTVSYNQAQLLAIFGQPAMGNGLISLAHQLIATKLNLCNGSSPTNIQATINAADAMIGGLVIPPVGGGSLAPGATSGMTNTLDNYNNGILPGVVACATPTRHSTWGQVKTLYR